MGALTSDLPVHVDATKIIVRVDVDTEPVSKARPRFNGAGRVYTPSKTIAYERTLSIAMRHAMEGRAPVEGACGLVCIFYRTTGHRVDCDNMVKAVADAANRVIWVDDVQCLEIYARVYRDAEQPRVTMVFYAMDDMQGVPCAHCGKPFRRPPSQMGNHCSVACSIQSKRVDVTCKHCGKVFSQPQSVAKRSKGYCSRACGVAASSGRDRVDGSDKWICADCGGRVTRKEYEVCRGCSMKRRSDPTSNYWRLRHPPKSTA